MKRSAAAHVRRSTTVKPSLIWTTLAAQWDWIGKSVDKCFGYSVLLLVSFMVPGAPLGIACSSAALHRSAVKSDSDGCEYSEVGRVRGSRLNCRPLSLHLNSNES